MSSAPTNEFPFIITTIPNTKSFSFNICAAGKFVIDWGDGNIEKINKNLTGERTISHSYKNAAPHEIKLGGKATGYDGNAAISFHENTNLAKIDGSLGQIFSTLSDGTQPHFGTPWYWHGTFQECTNLTGSIPENLFAGIKGAAAKGMFLQTFLGCSGLSGTMDNLGRIKNKKAPSAVTATKKESKPVIVPEFKPMPDMQTSNTLCVNISLSGNMIEKIPNLKSNIIGGVCSAYFAKNTNTDVQIKCDSVDDNKFTVIISEKQNSKQR